MKNNKDSIQLSVRLMGSYFTKFHEIANGRNNTETIKSLIDGHCYANNAEVCRACVELSDAINILGKETDSVAYQNVRGAHEKLCQSLLTN